MGRPERRRFGAALAPDRVQCAISNVDDHLRNHGFRYEGTASWRLSSPYDMNPVPIDVKPRVLTTAIDPTIQARRSTTHSRWRNILASRTSARKKSRPKQRHRLDLARDKAAELGLARSEVNRMASAFEPEDLRKAKG